MDAKWIPILAAGLGVLGGIGGAIVGGSLANAAQENQLESEQEAAISDLRRATHARYLGAADACFIAQGVAKDIVIEDGVPTQNEEVAAVGFLRPQLLELFGTQGAVALLTNSDVAAAADKLTDELEDPDLNRYDALRSEFIRLAREEIESDE